jgi:hypothetical protein
MGEPRTAVITGASRALASRRRCTFTTPRTEARKDYNNMGGRPRRIEERCGTVPVMFWQNGFDDTDAMMGVRHPLTSTGAVRICTGKTA